jgi:RNA binding exosome subunit
MTKIKHSLNRMKRALSDFRKMNFTGYRLWTLPNETDEKISRIIDLFMSMNAEEKSHARKLIKGRRISSILLAYSERMAILAVRIKSKEPLARGLFAHILEDFKSDDRENLLVLSLIRHSANKIGVNVREIIAEARNHATMRAKEILDGLEKDFSSIREMGYRETKRDGQFWYERDW